MKRASRFRPLVLGAGISLAAGLAACGNGPPASPGAPGGGCTAGTAGVSLGTGAAKVAATDQLQFTPTSEAVKKGQIVEWDNPGTQLHNITFGQTCLTDGNFQPGGKWQVKFTAAGSYPYQCTIHQGMVGTITVS